MPTRQGGSGTKKLLAAQLQPLQTMIGSIERRLTVQHRANEASKRLQGIHGIGISTPLASRHRTPDG